MKPSVKILNLDLVIKNNVYSEIKFDYKRLLRDWLTSNKTICHLNWVFVVTKNKLIFSCIVTCSHGKYSLDGLRSKNPQFMKSTNEYYGIVSVVNVDT